MEMFRSNSREVRLLDAGAGTGNLTDALVRRFCAMQEKPERVLVTAYELDTPRGKTCSLHLSGRDSNEIGQTVK